MRAREIVLAALLAALLMAAQVALAGLPNIELVTLLLALYMLEFPRRVALSACAVFIMLQGLLYGFTMWWFNWLYIWPLWLLIVWLMRRNTSIILWAVAAGAFGLGFGALCAVPYLFVGGIYGAFSYWVAGILFDVAHCAGNALSVLLLMRPLRRAFTAVSGSVLQ